MKYNLKNHSFIFICIITVFMFLRMFYGTELTDEAFYISDSIAMLHGNTAYSYNNFSYGSGAGLFSAIFYWLFEKVNPSHTGIMLFSRICYLMIWYIVMYVIYIILKKKYCPEDVLIFVALLSVCHPGQGVYDFSYNSFPFLFTILSMMIMYNTVEIHVIPRTAHIFLSGFFMGCAIIAHPGYTVAAIVGIGLLLVRTINSPNRYVVRIYIGGMISVIAFTIWWICTCTNWNVFCDGIRQFYSSNIIIALVISILLLYVIYLYRYRINAALFVDDMYIEKAGCKVALYIILATIFWAILKEANFHQNGLFRFGIIGSLLVGYIFVCKIYVKNLIFLYLGVYPVIYSVLMMVMVDHRIALTRFSVASLSFAIGMFCIISNKGNRSIIIYGIMSIVTIFICCNNVFYIYRDSPISELNVQVSEGVYAGIYTTDERAHDLPEMEKYLNSIICENDYYAFRDNVPAAYLMMHHGRMCGITTWDELNYSYGRNAPELLYSYYKRRNVVPDIIVYVDYGRDNMLSIYDANYKYNDFVNENYELKVEEKVNATFLKVVVFERIIK